MNATALFNHAAVAIPAWRDRPLRRVPVTPDMHRVHHSGIKRETDSDFGFRLSARDRLLGTCIAESARGQPGMVIDVEGLRADPAHQIDRLLLQPFKPGI